MKSLKPRSILLLAREVPGVATRRRLVMPHPAWLSSSVNKSSTLLLQELAEKEIDREAEPSWTPVAATPDPQPTVLPAAETTSTTPLPPSKHPQPHIYPDRGPERWGHHQVMLLTRSISRLGRTGQWDAVVAEMEQARARGVIPDAEAYCAAMLAAQRCGRWQEGLALLEEMKLQGVTPTLLTWRAAKELAAKGGQQDLVDRLLRDAAASAPFELQSSPLRETPAAAEPAAEAAGVPARAQEPSRAAGTINGSYLKVLDSSALAPPAEGLQLLGDGDLERSGRAAAAALHLDDCDRRPESEGRYTLASSRRGGGGGGGLESAAGAARSSSSRVTINEGPKQAMDLSSTYNPSISRSVESRFKEMGRAKNWRQGVAVFGDAVERGHLPDAALFARAVAATARAGAWEETMALLRHAHALGPDEVAKPYAAAAAVAALLPRTKPAMRLLQQARTLCPAALQGCRLHEACVASLCHVGHAEAADELVQEMTSPRSTDGDRNGDDPEKRGGDGIAARTQTYELLLDGLAKARQGERAAAALRRMRAAGLPATTSTWNLTLAACARQASDGKNSGIRDSHGRAGGGGVAAAADAAEALLHEMREEAAAAAAAAASTTTAEAGKGGGEGGNSVVADRHAPVGQEAMAARQQLPTTTAAAAAAAIAWPDLQSYREVLTAQAAAGRGAAAAATLREAIEASIGEPDGDCYGAVALAYARGGEAEAALTLLEHLLQSANPKIRSPSPGLSSATEQQQQQQQQQRLRPSAKVLAACIEAFRQATPPQLGAAKRIMELMHANADAAAFATDTEAYPAREAEGLQQLEADASSAASTSVPAAVLAAAPTVAMPAVPVDTREATAAARGQQQQPGWQQQEQKQKRPRIFSSLTMEKLVAAAEGGSVAEAVRLLREVVASGALRRDQAQAYNSCIAACLHNVTKGEDADHNANVAMRLYREMDLSGPVDVSQAAAPAAAAGGAGAATLAQAAAAVECGSVGGGVAQPLPEQLPAAAEGETGAAKAAAAAAAAEAAARLPTPNLRTYMLLVEVLERSGRHAEIPQVFQEALRTRAVRLQPPQGSKTQLPSQQQLRADNRVLHMQNMSPALCRAAVTHAFCRMLPREMAAHVAAGINAAAHAAREGQGQGQQLPERIALVGARDGAGDSKAGHLYAVPLPEGSEPTNLGEAQCSVRDCLASDTSLHVAVTEPQPAPLETWPQLQPGAESPAASPLPGVGAGTGILKPPPLLPVLPMRSGDLLLVVGQRQAQREQQERQRQHIPSGGDDVQGRHLDVLRGDGSRLSPYDGQTLRMAVIRHLAEALSPPVFAAEAEGSPGIIVVTKPQLNRWAATLTKGNEACGKAVHHY